MFFGDLLISAYMLVAFNTPSIFPLRDAYIEDPDIIAHSALVYDIERDRFLLEKNSEDELPIASLAKLISSLVVLDAIPLDKIVTVDEDAVSTPGDAGGFYAKEEVSARHLLFASLIQSSNDALAALANDLGLTNFLRLMRSKVAHTEGTVDIGDPVGLSLNTKASAKGLLPVVRAAFRNEFLTQILSLPEYTFRSESGDYHKLVSTNELIFNSRILAGKTGSLDEVGQNYAALVQAPNEEKLIVIILGSQNRKADMLTILDWLDSYFSWK
jgi:serine-type D-Ala-D-Ala endopeptidase (penicillin-binding protein 7)